MTSTPVRSMNDIPPTRAVLFDVTPRQLADIAGDALPTSYVKRLRRFRYGPGVFKVDWALDGPIPWRAEECGKSATVHVGGTIEEIAAHEAAIWKGRNDGKPFVLVAQQSLFDDTRAGREAHRLGLLPRPARLDRRHDRRHRSADRALRARLPRPHPGEVCQQHSAEYEAYNANMVGGDIAGGANTLMQFLARPFPRRDPYSTPNKRIYLASSSTPPGGGVHGMCGYWAAQSALRRMT